MANIAGQSINGAVFNRGRNTGNIGANPGITVVDDTIADRGNRVDIDTFIVAGKIVHDDIGNQGVVRP